MLDCLQGRDVVKGHQISLEKKILSDAKDMEANKANKTTLTNFWKSKSSKESKAVQLQSNIEINAQEVEDFKKLVNFLTIYHGQIAIPGFKSAK